MKDMAKRMVFFTKTRSQIIFQHWKLNLRQHWAVPVKQNTKILVLIQLQSKAAVQESFQTKVSKIQYAHSRSVDATMKNH